MRVLFYGVSNILVVVDIRSNRILFAMGIGPKNALYLASIYILVGVGLYIKSNFLTFKSERKVKGHT